MTLSYNSLWQAVNIFIRELETLAFFVTFDIDICRKLDEKKSE
jgi:hypothetical protein